MSFQKEVTYSSTNTYHTLNKLTNKTKNIWIVFHGLGYLSKYFIRYFSELDPDENYVIAPQAPSKYYQDNRFKHIGASWLTRENTATETENILNYVDAVYKSELANFNAKLIVLGYSQGVSIATRWVAKRKIQCDTLVLHSGGIPKELNPEDFEFLTDDTRVIYIYGDKDEYITEARKTEEYLKGTALFNKKLKIEVFNGKHEVYKPFLLTISK
ncbi:MAG: esterase [Aequorivita sp.]|nr:esterase [Aequorivita sp.]|tara:strand:+ start:1779 stop:2420 length:642 start_codon:yes stop_codon:yes gene_type:complete